MKILYLGQKPCEQTGSPIILLRHLLALKAEANQILFCLDWGQRFTEEDTLYGHTCYQLPHRKAWWPPYRANFEMSRILRTNLWARWLKQQLDMDSRPDAILSYMAWHDDLYAEIGARLGKLLNIPTVCLVHDDAADFVTGERYRQIRRRQNRILGLNRVNAFVSEALSEALAPQSGQCCAEVLPPIPEGHSPREFGKDPSVAFNVVYAGYLWPAQAKLLITLNEVVEDSGGMLSVAGKMPEEVEGVLQNAGIRREPEFETNLEALDFLQDEADVLLVSYAEHITELPWTETSFPSKLIEYSHLGLPIIVVAPEESCVMRWMQQRSFIGAFEPNDHDGIREYLIRLSSPKEYAANVGQWQNMAQSEWNPESIHQKLVEMLQFGSASA